MWTRFVVVRRLPLAPCARAFLSSSLSPLSPLLVSNVTPEKLAAADNEDLAGYMKANFPEQMDPNYQEKLAQAEPVHISKLNHFGAHDSAGGDGTDAHDESSDAAIAAQFVGMSIDPALKARNIRPMATYLRDAQHETNSRRSRYLRFHKLIPGLLYGGDPTRGIYSVQEESKIHVKTKWRLLEREVDRFYHEMDAHVYNLTVLENKESPDDPDVPAMDPQLVVPANIQRHPVQEKLYCVNYVRYHPGRPLKLPVRHVNVEESPALKRDGYLLPIERRVECFVEEGVPIPEALELECTGLRFREVVRTDRLILPEGVKLSHRVLEKGNQFIVAVVDGRSRDDEDQAEEGAQEGATA